MRLVLVGPPGSGKGTQAEWLCERFGLTSIGTGNLLREAIRNDSPIVKDYRDQYARGVLAPDETVNELVAELFRTQRPDKFLVDGYPRTYSQAIAFNALLHQEFLKLDAVLYFTMTDVEVMRRICGRRICSNSACASVANIHFRPPKVLNVCDKCGSSLIQRDDDREEAILRRLADYRKSAGPLLEHYRKAGLLREVSTMQEPEAVHDAILRQLT